MLNNTLDINELLCRSCNSTSLYKTRNKSKEWFLCRDCLFHQSFDLAIRDDMKFNITYEWGVTQKDNVFSEEVFIKEVEEKTKRILKLQSLGMVFKSVLDVGCGSGPFLEASKNLKIKAIGIEPSLANTKYCQKKGYKVFNGFVEDVQLETASFDAVNMEDVFSRTTNPIKSLEKIRNHLAQDGYLFWKGRDYLLSPLNITSNLRKGGTQNIYISKPAVSNILGLTGFKLISYKKRHGCFSLIAKKGDHYKTPKVSYLTFILHFLFLKNCSIWDNLILTVSSYRIPFKSFFSQMLFPSRYS
jgi:SAM-dependent methyltransferase